MRRHAIGIIGLLLLAGAVVLWLWPPQSGNKETWGALHAAFSRVGVLCAVVWLAYRELERLPAWLFAMIPVSGLVIAARPRLALIVIPLAFAIMILSPKKKSRTKR